MTTHTIGPALAFYLEHGRSRDLLWELGEGGRVPPEISAEDWQKFLDVMARASSQVVPWLEEAREQGIAALKRRADVIARSRKTAQDWYAWADLRIKPKRGLKGLSIGVEIGAYPEGEGDGSPPCYFSSYLIVAGGDGPRRDLHERLVKEGATEAKLGADWFGIDCISLGFFPVERDTDPNTVIQASTACFAQLDALWPRLFA